MPLKQTEYTTIEITEDGEYGMVIGNIVLDKNKMLYAEIVSGTICDHGELVNARAFLDEVDDAMNVETEPIIDEGCAGCCKVVDVAARMQKELDECNERCTKLGSHNMQITANLLDRKAIIEEYKEAIRLERIDRGAEKEMINRKFCEDLRKLNATIEELKDNNIDDLKELYDFHEGEIEWFKDELSARKEDYEVLKNVVEIIRDNGIYPHGAMNELADLLVDYLDAPERTDSTTIDSREYNVTPDNTSYTVEMDIRCE